MRTWLLVLLLLLTGVAHAADNPYATELPLPLPDPQTHTFCALDVSCVWTAAQTFAGGITNLISIVAVPFSATPVFNYVTGSQETTFTMVLTGNVTSSTISGSFNAGLDAQFIICQDTVGNHTFVWPTSFINPPSVGQVAGNSTPCSVNSSGVAVTFVFCGSVGSISCPANSWHNTDQGPAGIVPTGGAPTQWVNITQPPYNAVGDGRDVLCGVTNTTPNVTSAGLFLVTDAGKEIYIYNTNNGNALTLGTILTVTDSSNIILSGNAQQTVGTQQCHIGTNNYLAIHAAELALKAGQTLYAPSGIYLWDNHQIFNSGILVTATPMTLMGDGENSTEFWFPPFATTATTSQVVGMSNNVAYVHDFRFRPGPEQAVSTSNQNFVASITGNPVYNVGFDNFLATSIPTACWASSVDGTKAINPESTGCAVGLYDQWKTQSIIHGQFQGTINGAKLFDFGGQLIGGSYNASTGNNPAILNVVQGTPEAWQIIGATIIGNGTGCAYSGGANTAVELIGNNIGTSTNTNDSGICLTSASAKAYASGNSIFSHGTGFGVNNTGQYFDLGGNQHVQVGAGVYTGAGTINGKVTLMGAAYTNATTTFSTVVGGAGPTFTFQVDPNDVLNVTCQVMWQGSANTAGPKFQWTGPAGVTAVAAYAHQPITTSTYLDAVATAFSTSLPNTGTITAATNFVSLLTLGVQNGATGGPVTLQAAANGAGTLTIQPGSFCYPTP